MPKVMGVSHRENVSLTPDLRSNAQTQHWALAPGTWAAGTSLCTRPFLTAPPDSARLGCTWGAAPGGQQAEGEQAGDGANPRGWKGGSSGVAGGQDRASSCRDESPDL